MNVARALYTIIVLALTGAMLVGPAAAQRSGQQPAVFDGVGMDEHLGDFVPGDVMLVNEAGERVALSTYLNRERPVLLNFVYHNCPMLCNLLLTGLNTTLKQMSWVPGEQFEVVSVSFAPDEGPALAARVKERYIKELGKPDAARGWHFLTGEQAEIRKLADAVGFQYRWVEAQQEYAHPAALIFLSPEGRITRYLHGLEFDPRDTRTALVEAGEGTVGSPLDQVILYCFQYDPSANSYVPHAINIMKLGGLLTMLLVGSLLFVMWRREAHTLRSAEASWQAALRDQPSA